MLRSTGFFRGIDCPFYTEYCNGKSDKDGCNRPYCHFRHGTQRRSGTSYVVSDVRKSKELDLKQKVQGYDPFNPDVVGPEEQNGESASVDVGALELQLVNRAIEEAHNEVERQKRKLSRFGEEEYDPTASSNKTEEYDPTVGPVKVGSKKVKTVQGEYVPTVSPVKVGAKKKRRVSEEYVPTASSAKTVSEEYVPTASSTKTVSEEYVPTASLAKTEEEYVPTVTSAKAGVKRLKTSPEDYVPTATPAKAGVKRQKTSPEEYVPTTSFNKVGDKKSKCMAVASHLAYDPASYQMTFTADYNPTPKYTLDSDNPDSHASSMEYVPTSVSETSLKKPAHRTHTAPLPSPPVSPKYSTTASSSKSTKYTLDHSKPSTDMEYDPLSNYSAKPTDKNKRDEAAKAEGNKKKQLPGTGKSSNTEDYVPTVKKARQPSTDMQKYTLSFSESDEESSNTEYRPTSLSRIQQKKSSGGLVEDTCGAGQKERTLETHSKVRGQEQSGDKENPPHREPAEQEVSRHKDRTGNDRTASKSGVKSSKTERSHKVEKESVKKSSHKEKPTGDKGGEAKISLSKKSSHDGLKKDGKSQGKREEKSKLKEKSNNKCRKDEKRNYGKSHKPEKVKSDSSKREKESGGSSKTPKTSNKETDSHKNREHKNGNLDSSRREKNLTTGKGSSNDGSSKGSSMSSKDKAKKISSSGVKVSKVNRRSLSHVDLFGDESAEELDEEEEQKEEDEEMDDVKLVRRLAVSFQGRSGSKRKASELTQSSSEEEDVGVEDDRADMNFDSGVDYSCLQEALDLDLDSDPMEECLRIFNESKDVKTEDKGRQAKQLSKDSEDEEDTETTLTTLFPGQKKRVSHFSAKSNTDAPPKSAVQPVGRRASAQEMCYQRMQIAQQQALQLAAAVKSAAALSSPRLSPSPKPSFPGERKRVAHRPSPLASSSKTGLPETRPAARPVLSPTRSLSGHPAVKAHTSAGILSKTTSTVAQRRVAHTPTLKSTAMKRPVIPTAFGAKVPTNIRQRYLNAFIDECVKFCPSEEAAFQMGLDEEKLVYERSSSKNIYLNVAVNTLQKLRGKGGSPTPPVYSNSSAVAGGGNKKALSHEQVLGGRLAAKTSFTINRSGKQQEQKLTGVTLYRKLREYLMTEEQLQEHSYPRPHPELPGRAVVHNVPEKKNTDPFAKVCCRCGAEYKINANGNCVRKEECHHHWGRVRRHKVSGGWETAYNCCSGAVGSTGCQVSKQHVQDGRKESLGGYVQTFDKSLPPDGNGGVYALDCEMCYTKTGLELTRVTVINSDLKVIYDTFVKPEAKVVDYNTRFSGVTEEDLENATITLRDVQAVLLNMFGAESILIGHSLESDLFALKLIHSSVVDTAIVFPHRLGLPYKRALRNLMADHLKRIIQDNVEGHDSSEDACACMELMMWKIREDAKVKR